MVPEKSAGVTTHNCDLCGSAEFTVLEHARRYIGSEQPPVVCKDCGFIYVRERRQSHEVIESWRQMYLAKAYDPTWPGVRARLFYVAEWISQNFTGGAKFHDLGGGDGWLASEMTRRNWRASTYDPAFGQERLLAAGEYDIVTITWTLENCVDCNEMLTQARALLKPSGHLVIATGSRIRVPPRKELGTYFSKTPADTHCFRWSPTSLTRALVKNGFGEPRFNDYEQNDVLLACAAASGKPAGEILLNEHNAVLTHFQQWSLTWP